MRDVVVIGAGPAGSITAQLLAGAGRDVVVLEEHAGAGTPVHCTGLLGFDAFEEFDLPRDLILGRADAARFWGAAGRSVLVHCERVEAAVIDRARLDRTLAARAAAAGAELRMGSRAESITVTRRGVSVAGRGLSEPIEARACVLACGASYRFHRQLGLGLPQVFLQSAQLEVMWPNVPQIEVRFGQAVAPSGFAWLVPLQRQGVPHARIGMMAAHQSRARFQTFLAWLAAEAGLDVADMPRPNFKMLPLGPVDRTYGDRVVAVGDAAGLVKPTTGGGIFYGLVSGALAAQVLDGALDRDRLAAAELRRYESAWRRRLGQEIRIGLAFRRIAAKLSDESIDDLIELARVNGVVPLLQQTASFNWHRKAAIALLGHPAFRKIVFKSVVRDGAFL
ncbi:MAG TPA: NAD(P)/FAD-dependent oxidoreductase [Vicinamibacterales bacterium]|nr:NAD(P)/FAD-dependent oxidoreductase [Vicinamibacterales bacterium]